MNEPTFHLKPLGAALRLKTTKKKQVSTIQRNIHKQFYNSLTDTPTKQAILLSQSTSHTGAHLMQLSSEAYEAEDRCFRVSVARRLMLPHPAAPNAADVVQFCTNKSAAGVICNKPVDPQQHHCYGCRYGGGVDRRHAAVGDALRTSFNHVVAPRYSLNRRHLLSPVLSTDRFNTLGWILSLTSTVRSRTWMCPLLLPSLAIRPWSQQPAQNQDLWPEERKRTNLTDIHT